MLSVSIDYTAGCAASNNACGSFKHGFDLLRHHQMRFVVRVAATGHQFRQAQTDDVAGFKGQHRSRVEWDKHHAASQQRNAASCNAWYVKKVRWCNLFGIMSCFDHSGMQIVANNKYPPQLRRA